METQNNYIKNISKKLDQLYNDPKSPAAFAGAERLWQEVKKNMGEERIRKKDVINYLQNHRTYTLMRPRRVHFPRAKTVAAGFMTDVQVDLADFQALSRKNNGRRYILVAIDVLSKRLFAAPLRTKKSEDMVEAFQKIISQMPMKPHRIFSDRGTEFKNKLLKDYFAKEEIEKFEANFSTVKASLAERAIRNLKQRIYRYFSQHQTEKWTDVLQQIVDGINHSKSRVTGMRPVDVNFKNAQQVWEEVYGYELRRKRHKHKDTYNEGDFVRMSRDKGHFEKGYLPNWGDEILEVDAVKRGTRPVRYNVQDEKGEKFKGSFYKEELARVRKDTETTFRIEKVFRNRKRADGTREYLVKFIGYPDREWVHESQFVYKPKHRD